jgi:hypothetical protein
MFAPKVPLGSEFIKFFKSSDLGFEYQDLVEKIVMYMANEYYKVPSMLPFHLSDGSTTDSRVKSLQTLMIDIDAPSDTWLLQVYDKTPIPFVKFYISSSSRINLFNPVYTLDLSIANNFIKNEMADIAYGFDRSTKVKAKSLGFNIFSWLLPSRSFYGKEKWIYIHLKNIGDSRKERASTDINHHINALEFINSLNSSEKIIKIEEDTACNFLIEQDNLISNRLGNEKFCEILSDIGIDPENFFIREIF